MRRAYFIVVAGLFCACTAYANPIPTFSLTQGTVSVTSDISGTSLSWDFSGLGGAFAGGIGTASFGCFNGVLAGDFCGPDIASGTYTLNPVPEPSSIALLGTGVLGLLGRFSRRKG